MSSADTTVLAASRDASWPTETLLLHTVWLLCHEVVSLRDDLTSLRRIAGVPSRQPTTLEATERHALLEALEAAQWVQTDAAELLGISPRVMAYKLQQLGLDALSRKVRRLQR